MKRLTVQGENWGSTVEEEMIRVLQQGGIVLHPTETCYGLAVDAFNEEAIGKLYKLKKMDVFKPVSIVVFDSEDAKNWAEINEKTEDIFNRFWPGPYTFLLHRKKTLPQFFNRGAQKVGLRNPSYKSLLNVVKKFGHPITTTSANISGKSETYDINDFFTQLKSVSSSFQPDLVIDGGFIGVNEPSSIYDTVDGVVVRGSIKID